MVDRVEIRTDDLLKALKLILKKFKNKDKSYTIVNCFRDKVEIITSYNNDILHSLILKTCKSNVVKTFQYTVRTSNLKNVMYHIKTLNNPVTITLSYTKDALLFNGYPLFTLNPMFMLGSINKIHALIKEEDYTLRMIINRKELIKALESMTGDTVDILTSNNRDNIVKLRDNVKQYQQYSTEVLLTYER